MLADMSVILDLYLVVNKCKEFHKNLYFESISVHLWMAARICRLLLMHLKITAHICGFWNTSSHTGIPTKDEDKDD